jgi:hypothetical protein
MIGSDGGVDTPIDVIFLRDTRHGGDADQTQQLVGFLTAATEYLHIAIYDAQLSEPVAAPVVAALRAAATRGVDVKIAYDAGKPTAQTAAETVAAFAATGADPAPAGTSDWLTQQLAGSGVQRRPSAPRPGT